MSVAIGIDLGTTNTVVATVVDGVAITLEDEQQRRLIPSVVSFHPSGSVLVGDAARERRLIDPENTIYSIKPLLGRPFDSDEVKAAKGRFPFQLVEGAKNSTMVQARDVAYALPEISAFILRRAKAVAEYALKQQIDRAVITVPANFNDLQRASTKIAGKLAGLEVMRILNEPTAAALAYGQSIAKAEKIGVYDLGGGTFDVTLLDLTGNVFEVLATAGDTTLGGDDIDRLLAEKIALEVIRRFNYDPRSDPVAFARLRFIAEDLKKELSVQFQVGREISGVGYTEGGNPINMPFTITREEFERLALPLIERTMSVARQSIEIIGLHPKDFDRIILVGGSTRMPMVGRMVEQLFAQPPHLKVNPDEVVALGAAIQAHALNRSKAAHKRRGTSEGSQPGATHMQQMQAPAPPNENEVPRAPAVPTGVSAPPGMSGPPGAPQVPQFIAFQKAAATISFSAAPPGAQHGQQPSAPPQVPGARPPLPPSRKPSPPPVPKRGATNHATTASEASRGAVRPIEGAPVRPELSSDAPFGPKPARRSGHPEALPSVPDLDLEMPQSGPPAEAGVYHPQLSAGPPSGQLGAVVAEGDFFPDQGPSQAARGAAPVAMEAFQRGSAIAMSDNAPLLIDVTPLSLRVETVGGYSDVLITANSPVPCEKARTFLTAADNQTMVVIRVAQGDSARFAENTYLGELELSGLAPARRGGTKILVTFELDADGILNVRAKDKDTARETKATMRLLGTSTDAAEVNAMMHRQQRHIVA